MSQHNIHTDTDPERIQVFIDKLRIVEERRIYARDYWQLFIECFPHRPRGSEARQWLLLALRAAATANVIKLPVEHGKCWERDIQPALPVFITRIIEKVSREEPWRQFPWQPELAWVAALTRLSSEQEQFLYRVHEGLVCGEFDQPAPFKYRSLKLTGHEKTLGHLVQTTLFGAGRLTLDLLGCIPDVPPLAHERIGICTTAIVFENVGAFRVACQVLSCLPNPPYGLVAFGGGAGFRRSVLAFRHMDCKIEQIDYVGDLDRPGLSIARDAANVAYKAGLAPVVAAIGVHGAMLKSARQLGHPLGWKYDNEASGDQDEALVALLPLDVRTDVLAVLRAGNRIPEEVLGPSELEMLWFLTSL